MSVYIRNKESGTWHWKPECPDYPGTKDSEIRMKKPLTGKFCTQCIKLSQNDAYRLCAARG